MFADRAKIYIRSGKGGDGHVSFRRELYVPNGGVPENRGFRGITRKLLEKAKNYANYFRRGFYKIPDKACEGNMFVLV